MARNYKELQAKMDAGSLADNRQRVREELQRMALEELRRAKQLTQNDMAEILNVPQSSISRIEQRADMYLSTLRNYIQAMGGVLQIQAVFPDGPPVVLDRFGDYGSQQYVVYARRESSGSYRLCARPPQFQKGVEFSTKTFKASGFAKAMKALHISEPHISSIMKDLENYTEVAIGPRVGGGMTERRFQVPDLVAAGFESTNSESRQDSAQ
jgi:predicted XRE-type DNA-binding protein